MPENTRIPERLYGITGMPLGHSLSPLIHNRAFELSGLPAVYMAFEKSPAELPALMDCVRNLPVNGLSVTIPHKRAVIEHLDFLTGNATAAGAVNTVYWDGGSLVGENTDVEGFLAPLRKLAKAPASALILGAGGAARAVFKGLADLGVEKVLASARDAGKAEKPCSEFGAGFVPWNERLDALSEADLIVNATPLGMSGGHENASPLDDPGREACLSPNQVVYDLVYNPLRTKLLQDAELQGCRTIEGLDMFVGQAAEQFRLWTGREFPAAEITALISSRLK
jgi:shikimate dehydrogenase